MIPIIGPLFSFLTTSVEAYAEHKKLKMQHKNEVSRAKIRRVQKLDDADADWDKLMAQGSLDSWKDEWWTLILSIPAILAFFPSAVGHVLAGFEALEQMPAWYKAAVGLAIAAAFGFRKFADRNRFK